MSKKISKLKMTSSIAVWITVQMAKMFLFTVVWNKNNNAHKFTSIQPLQMLVVLLNQSQNSCVFFFLWSNWLDKPVTHDLDVDALWSARFMPKCHFQPVQVNNLLSASAATDYSWV